MRNAMGYWVRGRLSQVQEQMKARKSAVEGER